MHNAYARFIVDSFVEKRERGSSRRPRDSARDATARARLVPRLGPPPPLPRAAKITGAISLSRLMYICLLDGIFNQA